MNFCTRRLFSTISAGFVHCLNAGYASVLVVILFLATGSTASQQALATSEISLQDRLLEIKKKGDVANFEIEKIPNPSAQEVDRIMGVLDRIMSKETPRIFRAHYNEVEKSIQNVSIPNNFNSFEIYWEQIKAGTELGENVIDDIVRNFVNRSYNRIEPLQVKISEKIDAKINDTLPSEMIQARSSIREPFQDVISGHFPDWPVPQFRGPSLPLFYEMTDPTTKKTSGGFGVAGGVGLIGGAILSKERIRKKIIEKATNCRKSCRENCR